MVVRFLFAIVLAEVLVELSKEALIFEPLRIPFRRLEPKDGEEESKPSGCLERLKWKIGDFLDCGYCQSVWGGWLAAFVFRLQVGAIEWWPWVPWWADTLVCGLLVHRAANVLHEGVSRWLGRAPLQVLLVRREIAEPESEGNGANPDSDIAQEETDGHDEQ
jgi:hypothetical protein